MTLKGWLKDFRRTKVYDLLVALPLLVWFGRGGWKDAQSLVVHVQQIRAGTETTVGFLQMIAMTGSIVFCSLLVVMLLVRTLPRARANGVLPRVFAVTGTFLGTAFLYLSPVPLTLAWQITAVVLIILAAGLGVVVMTWLGRSFAIMPEARQLVTNGPYRLVRHPLYVVETIGMTAMLIQFFSLAGAALFVAYLAVQVGRALFEERVLGHTFPEYQAYAERTARFIPYIC
jgi:protein-S-isoprenylcysteine O-methyltransferase Ste14